ncbi:MAG: DUF775 domain-containing protein [archaeon]|nr:DUF775 domain-containing protein [archaeon]
MIGVIIPGTPLLTGGPVTSGSLILEVSHPKEVNNISFFLMEDLPDINSCVSLYYSIPPYDDIIYMGLVCNTKLSDVFQTDWKTNQNVNVFDNIRIIFQYENLSYVANNFGLYMTEDTKKRFYKEKAQDLINFIKASNMNNPNNNQMILIKNETIENWFKECKERYEK